MKAKVKGISTGKYWASGHVTAQPKRKRRVSTKARLLRAGADKEFKPVKLGLDMRK